MRQPKREIKQEHSMGCGLGRRLGILFFSVAATFFFFSQVLRSMTARAAVAAELNESWKVEWVKIVEGARKEGRLSLYLYHGDGELEAVAGEFQKKYPEIVVTRVTGRGNQLGPRIMAERRAGKYLVDVYIGGPTTPYTVFYPAKVLDPIRSALILPEVVDESKWWQGRHHYIDPENKYIFVFVGSASGGYVSYNSELVNPREFNSYWDLVQSRWKGKVLSKDPTREGQIAYQKVTNTPINSEESMRIDIPKERIPPEDRRLQGVKYLLFDRPEFMDMKPIYELLDRAMAERKK